MSKSNLICFDTETTGLVHYFNSLIEISAIRFNLDGEIQEKFTSLLDPMKMITQEITDLTGITNEDLKDAPPFWEVLENFADFIQEDDILFAHNAYFDASFVGLWMSKIMDVMPSNKIYNTIDIAKHAFPGFRSYKLSECIKNFNLDGENAHRAEADVLATISLIKKCFKKTNTTLDNVKKFLVKHYKYYSFRQYAIKPISIKNDIVKVIYSAIIGKKNLKIKYNYSTSDIVKNKIYEDINLQPLSIFQYKNEIYLEGFSNEESYFRRIDLKRIDKLELIRRDENFIKPSLKKKEKIKVFSQTKDINRYYFDLLSIEQTSKIIPKYTVLNSSSVCEALVRDYTIQWAETGREDFSSLISIVSKNNLVNDILITFLDKIRSAGTFIRHNSIKASLSEEEVNYFVEGSYEIINAITKDKIPDRENILYYATKEDYENKLRKLKTENDKVIKNLSDQLLKLREQINQVEEYDKEYDSKEDYPEQKSTKELEGENARLEEEIDVAIGVAEDLENKLYIIQEEMEKLKTEQFISKIMDEQKSKLQSKDFDTRNIENTIVLANQGFQSIRSVTGKEYEAVKLIILMKSGETATALIRGIWCNTAIHLKRNDRINFINVYTPNWKEARIFHVFDKYINTNINYPISYLVIEPDLLYQATTISRTVLRNDIFCTNIHKINNVNNENLINKPMLKGILVNMMLDEYFLSKGNFDFEKDIIKIIESKILEIAYCYDASDNKEIFNEIYKDLYSHYQSILNLFPPTENNKFPNFFEPHLLSSMFGLEGRLDLFYLENQGPQENNSKDAIYEVKSGNPHTDHAYQLWVYKLNYLSAYKKNISKAKLIYTKKSISSQLRDPFIPVTRESKLIEPSQLVINLRNHLALIDLMMGNTEERSCPEIPLYMKNEDLCSRCFFKKKNCLAQRDLFGTITDDEAYYYRGFAKLIYGNELMNRLSSSALWNKTVEEKKDSFAIITDLKIINMNGREIKLIIENKNHKKEDPKLKRARNTSDFKVGDLAFLHKNEITDGLLFKCTILEINNKFIKIKLNKSYISTIEGIENGWVLDKAFYLTSSQKERNGLYKFLTSHIKRNDNARFKQLILGKIRPEFSDLNSSKNESFIKFANISKLNERQLEAVKIALSTKDYFLIQGPPGTGKSYTLAVLSYELAMRGEKVLISGFTNRSVDNALLILKNELEYNNFIRIGSYYSIDDEIKPYSANALSKKYSISTFNHLKENIDNTNIFASTAFSADHFIINNVLFDTVIVDESSQMTEPTTLLVISKGKKFILFGDHKQLPPVINLEQPENMKFPSDNKMYLNSLSQSLFERLIKINENFAEELNDNSIKKPPASIMLNVQYRMNSRIAEFPSIQFYNDKLLSAPNNAERILDIDLKKVKDTCKEYLHPKRKIVFINVSSKVISKENREEAKIVRNLVTELLKTSISKNEIGIITPYKAQCALIRREIAGIIYQSSDSKGNIVVDTVERYQGGHKEVIIVSFTVSDNNMMSFLAEENDDVNLNRRLNVSLTRARSKIILIGNKSVLVQDKVYRTFINYLKGKGLIFEYISEKQLEFDLMF